MNACDAVVTKYRDELYNRAELSRVELSATDRRSNDRMGTWEGYRCLLSLEDWVWDGLRLLGLGRGCVIRVCVPPGRKGHTKRRKPSTATGWGREMGGGEALEV